MITMMISISSEILVVFPFYFSECHAQNAQVSKRKDSEFRRAREVRSSIFRKISVGPKSKSITDSTANLMRQTEAQRRGVEDVVDRVEERLTPSCLDDRRLRHVDVLGPKTAVAVERRAVLAHAQPIHLASRRSFCSLPHGTLYQSFIFTAFRLLCVVRSRHGGGGGSSGTN